MGHNSMGKIGAVANDVADTEKEITDLEDLTDIEENKEAFCNNCLLTASTNKVESKKRLRLVHSTTR